MKNYHISPDGVVRECKAEKRFCSFSSHFQSYEECVKYNDFLNELRSQGYEIETIIIEDSANRLSSYECIKGMNIPLYVPERRGSTPTSFIKNRYIIETLDKYNRKIDSLIERNLPLRKWKKLPKTVKEKYSNNYENWVMAQSQRDGDIRDVQILKKQFLAYSIKQLKNRLMLMRDIAQMDKERVTYSNASASTYLTVNNIQDTIKKLEELGYEFEVRPGVTESNLSINYLVRFADHNPHTHLFQQSKGINCSIWDCTDCAILVKTKPYETNEKNIRSAKLRWLIKKIERMTV